jgi:deazaflavin-dependent oxidoreductase (nitroreductase family)
MSDHPYIKPNWMQRHVGNTLAPLFQPKLIAKLSVRGRRTGRLLTVPVAVLDYEGERYLISYRGESDWARNLRASGTARLRLRGKDEQIAAVEVPVEQRSELLDAYRERFAKMPTVGGVLRALPDPAQHPTFRITPAR